MDTKVQNIVLKSITGLIIFLGVLFTVMVMGDDNPAEMSYAQQEQWAIKEAKDLKLNEELSLVNTLHQEPQKLHLKKAKHYGLMFL